MNSPHHQHHEHHDVHQQRLLWFFTFCNQRSSSSSSSSSGSATTNRRSRRKTNRNKFAAQYQQQLQQQKRQISNVFGCDLTEHTYLFCEQDSVPHIVKACTKFIEKHGIIFGIYRLSGMRVNIHKLRQDFDKNPKISMIDSEAISNDAHAVACVLKQYFRELPIPLLTFHMYERFIELFKQSNTSTTTSKIKQQQDDATVNQQRDSSITTTTFSNNIGHNELHPRNSHDDYDDDNNKDGSQQQTTNNTTNTSMAHKSKSSIQHPTTNQVQNAKETTTNNQFTSSQSDSQLLSLSSVVTTTTSDIRYQVKLDDLKSLLQQLPRPHYQTLKFLMRHLACIAANGEKTGMDSKNVAIVWAPNLLKPRELELSAGLETLQVIGLQAVITEQLIKHHKFLFDDYDNAVAETMQGTSEVSEDQLPDNDNDIDKQQQLDQSIDGNGGICGDNNIEAQSQNKSTAMPQSPEPPCSSMSQVDEDAVMMTQEDKELTTAKDVDNNQQKSSALNQEEEGEVASEKEVQQNKDKEDSLY